MRVDERVQRLEEQTNGLEARLRRLEAATAPQPRRLEAATAPRPRRLEAAPAPRPAAPAAREDPIARGPRVAGPQRSASSARGGQSAKPRADLEDLLGGRVLAWVGGIAVLVGVALLFGIALSRGWLDETARTLLGGGVSLALLLFGVRQKARGRGGDAAFAAAAAGVAGLLASWIVAGAVYALVPPAVALAGTSLTGAAATTLAVRWRNPAFGALGILGALLSPALVGAPDSVETVALLAVIAASSTGVLVWQRWTWLAFATFAIVTPQWFSAVGDGTAPATTIAVMATFGVLTAIAAVAHDLRAARDRAAAFGAAAATLLALEAIVLAALGAIALRDNAMLAHAWLAGLAVAHLAGGLIALRSRRASEPLTLTVLALATLLADLAFGAWASGLPLVLGWAASAVGLASVVRLAVPRSARARLAEAGLGGQLALALGHALTDDAPLHAAGHGGPGAFVALGGIAAACALSSRVIGGDSPYRRTALEAMAMAVLAYLTVSMLDGLALSLAWSGEAVALALVARRDERSGSAALIGALAFLGLATLHALTVLAPLDGVITGLAHPLTASLGLLAVAGAALACASASPIRWRAPILALALCLLAYLPAVTLHGAALAVAWSAGIAALASVPRTLVDRTARLAGAGVLAAAALIDVLTTLAPPAALVTGLTDPLGAGAATGTLALAAWLLARSLPADRGRLHVAIAVLVLYVGSIGIVTPFQPGDALSGFDDGALSIRQQGQALLSAAWALVGLVILVAGLVRDRRPWRRAGLALLTATACKVFLYDLSSLTSIYRVASFIALGLLLLAGAYVWQRMRPGPRPDLRTVPPALR